MTIWAITSALNVFLCLLMLFKGHYRRYKVLFLSLIFEIFLAPILYLIYFTYGTNSTIYSDLFHAKNFLTILFCFGIIWEGWTWRNQCIRIPQELYLLTLLAKFMAERTQFITISHGIYELLRYSGIGITIFLIYCFKGEERNERRAFRPPQTQTPYRG